MVELTVPQEATVLQEAAEQGTVFSGWRFVAGPPDATYGRAPVKQPAREQSRYRVPEDSTDIAGEEGEKEGHLTAGSNQISPDDVIVRAADAFIEAIERHLREDSADIREEGGVCPTQRAIETCLSLARKIVPSIVFAPELESAAFVEQTGAIALVLQSLQTHRRLTYRISPDGCEVSVLQIDENMAVQTTDVGIDDNRGLREPAEWVNART